MVNIPDVQDWEANVPIPIDMVGFKNIKIPAGRIILGGLDLILIPRFDVYIDLSKNKRGIHISRLYQAILETIKDYSEKTVKLDDLGREIAKKLLEENPESSKAYVDAELEAYYKAESPITKSKSYEPFKIYVKVRASKKSEKIEMLQFIGVESEGLTSCPCAREVIKTLYPGIDTTHMQRTRVRVFIQHPEDVEINILDLLNIVKSSFSSPLYSYLKRIDEAKVVADSLESAKFVEDTLREVVKKVIEKWSNLPDNSRIYVEVESIESIHPQNIRAYTKISVGEARSLLEE